MGCHREYAHSFWKHRVIDISSMHLPRTPSPRSAMAVDPRRRRLLVPLASAKMAGVAGQAECCRTFVRQCWKRQSLAATWLLFHDENTC